MTAPALVVLAGGSADPRVPQTVHAIRQSITTLRPELVVHGAFLDRCTPTGSQIIGQLARAGVDEAVLVPLDLAHAVEEEPSVLELVAWSKANAPQLSVVAARPIGPEVSLLSILDLRVRAALAGAHVLELDGLVLCARSAGDVRGSAMLARRARQWSTHHRLPCLTAVADSSGVSVAQAIQNLRGQGRRHIAVGSFFLTADEAYKSQADLARRCGAVAVSEPLGAAREVLDLIMARYAFAAMDLLAEDDPVEESAFHSAGMMGHTG